MKRTIIITVAVIASALLYSCQNKSHQTENGDAMPQFEQKFPQKSVWVHYNANDSTEITFSSMEEAEWKLIHVVSGCSYEDFEKILLSDPSSMDYPFDSLLNGEETFCRVFPPVSSNDGNVRCLGLMPEVAHQVPHMFIQYRINGEVRIAEEEFPSENCYFCLTPDTIFSFNTGNSTLYLVWGYHGYTGSGNGFRLRAYELDSTSLHPAFVFEEDVFDDAQGVSTEICFNDELFDKLAEENFKSVAYFEKAESAVYIQAYEEIETDECNCSTKMTNYYWKFVWNGKKFVSEK